MRTLLFFLCLSGCRSQRTQPPSVQFSSEEPASRVVTVTKRGNFSPPCITIAVGATVEWDNPHGLVINVTSGVVMGKPPELYSPSLVGSASSWRHTFTTPGRVDYFDQGGSGGGTIDPYYGTRSGSSTGAEGTVCVRASDGTGCEQLCCLKGSGSEQCGGGACVVPSDPEIQFGFCGQSTSAVDASTTD